MGLLIKAYDSSIVSFDKENKKLLQNLQNIFNTRFKTLKKDQKEL